MDFARALIAGGGSVGSLLAESLVSVCRQVSVFDLDRRDGVAHGDVLDPRDELLAALRTSDLVVLALPEAVILRALPGLLSTVQPDALVVETGSVKTPVEKVVKAFPGHGSICGINPMFAPRLGLKGQAVSLVEYTSAPKLALLEGWLHNAGASPVHLTAARHDKLVATVQAGTHAALLAFGESLRRAGDDFPDFLSIVTPPFQAMLLLLARIAGQNPETYWDIQASNPYAGAARRELIGSLEYLETLAGRDDGRREFARWVGAISTQLAPVSPELTVAGGEVLALLSQMRLGEDLRRVARHMRSRGA